MDHMTGVDVRWLGRRRVVAVGGISKRELLERLRACSIATNEYARIILASDSFMTANTNACIPTVECAVQDLGFAQGATLAEILAKAAQFGLGNCPLELGPHLRLQTLDQAEGLIGEAAQPHRAPPGSITIVSQPLSQEDDFPKGFYLRRMNGTLWLRGYCSSADHRWSPDDHLVFRES